jgi:hypothetical protein
MKSEDLERLDDYVRGSGTEEDASAFEIDLFTRALAGDARELVTYDWLVRTFRKLAERGTFMAFLSAAEAEKLRARYGERAALVDVAPHPERQVVVLPPSAELLVTRTALDLTGVERVDVEAHVEGVGVVKTMPDVAFDAAAGAVYGCCEMELARETVGMPILTKYWGHDRNGRRLLGEVLALTRLG